MKKLLNQKQYEAAVRRVEELLPLPDTTPSDDPRLMELKELSNLVANYSEEYFSLSNEI